MLSTRLEAQGLGGFFGYLLMRPQAFFLAGSEGLKFVLASKPGSAWNMMQKSAVAMQGSVSCVEENMFVI